MTFLKTYFKNQHKSVSNFQFCFCDTFGLLAPPCLSTAIHLLGEVVEGHPELALVPDARREQLLVALRQRVPLPAALAPRTVPLPFAPRVPQSAAIFEIPSY